MFGISLLVLKIPVNILCHKQNTLHVQPRRRFANVGVEVPTSYRVHFMYVHKYVCFKFKETRYIFLLIHIIYLTWVRY